MKQTLLLMIASLLLTGASSAAEPEPSALSETEVELGLGHVSDDSYRFGRYNGLHERGGYFLGNVEEWHRGDDGRYAAWRITDIGLDSVSALLEFGRQGRSGYMLEYDNLPSLQSDSGQTPFEGVGGASLTLPADWFAATPPPIDRTDDMAALASSLRPVELQTERMRLGVGAKWLPHPYWSFKVAYRYEHKDGLDVLWGALGNSPGDSRAAPLPEPIDYETNTLDVTLGYTRDKGQWELGYHISQFRNQEPTLRWDSPFSGTGARGVEGLISLPPDSQFHRLTLSGGYSLPGATRLSGALSLGLMLQDDTFQAYTVNTGLASVALPRDSLDGQVRLTTLYLKLASRPLPLLRLNASYRYRERDNRTPQDVYDYYIADSADDPNPLRRPTLRVNEPYSYDQHLARLDASYRIGGRQRVGIGYDFNSISRSPAEVAKTDEHTYRASYGISAFDTVSATFNVAHSQREGSAYLPRTAENPLLRRYNLADRDRDKLGLSLSFMPWETLSLSASADYVRDDYTRSEVGLTESTQPTYTLDASYTPAPDLTGYAFYTWENIESEQAGSETPTEPDWFVTNATRVDSIGLGVQRDRILGRWDVGLDYVYSKARGSTDITAPFGSLTGTGIIPFPDLLTRMHSLQLYARYQVRRDLGLKFSWWHERLDTDDWSLDGVAPATDLNVLLLGEDPADYRVNVYTISVFYRF